MSDPFEEDEDPWPDEPDEFDPDSIGPSVDIPTAPSPPEVRDYSEVDVPTEVATAFWSVVFLANVGLFCVSLGLMFVGFEGRLRLGGSLVGVGVVALLLGYRRYRAYMDRDRDNDD